MFKYLTFLAIVIFSLLSVSCEKVIELDLNDADQKYVIEGFINKDSTTHYVYISKTLKFDETSIFPKIDNASVTVSDESGSTYGYSLVSPGVYKIENFKGVEGKSYTLNVIIDGEKFSATSTMPYQVPIDSITYNSFSFGPNPVSSLIVNRKDPKGVKNYYNFNLYKNSKKINGVFIQDDQFADGDEILQPIFGADFKSGDTARIELMCIDPFVYKYFYTLDVNEGGTGGAVPANPTSNFGSKCLGYFSAQTKERVITVVP